MKYTLNKIFKKLELKDFFLSLPFLFPLSLSDIFYSFIRVAALDAI